MMKDFCFVCVAFNKEYVEQQERLKKSILDIYPDAELFFWTDRLPDHARSHYASHYGFKVHAIDLARQKGFDKIIFFDPACILKTNVDYWFDIVKEYGVVAAQDDNLLIKFCSQKAYDYFGLTKEESIENDFHLVGGSVYVFDFGLELCFNIFDEWMRAEIDDIFHSPSTEAYHRNDEACMALSLYKFGSRPTPYAIAGYNTNPNPVCIKKHFK